MEKEQCSLEEGGTFKFTKGGFRDQMALKDFCFHQVLERSARSIHSGALSRRQVYCFFFAIKTRFDDICLQKTGSETGFLAQNLDRLLDRDFLGRISDRKAEQVFKTWTGF